MSNPADELGGFLAIAFGMLLFGLVFTVHALWNLAQGLGLCLHKWEYIETIEHGVLIGGRRNIYRYTGDRVCLRCDLEQWTIFPLEFAQGTWKNKETDKP